MKIAPREGIEDAERHRRTPMTLAISVKAICVRMLGLCEADSMRDAGTTLSSATLAQKTAEQNMPKTLTNDQNDVQKSMPGRQQIDKKQVCVL